MMAFLAKVIRLFLSEGESEYYFNLPFIDPDTSKAITRLSERVLSCPSAELFKKRLIKKFLLSRS
jgi:hypothetical protein